VASHIALDGRVPAGLGQEARLQPSELLLDRGGPPEEPGTHRCRGALERYRRWHRLHNNRGVIPVRAAAGLPFGPNGHRA
jgi:hypothetical protein